MGQSCNARKTLQKIQSHTFTRKQDRCGSLDGSKNGTFGEGGTLAHRAFRAELRRELLKHARCNWPTRQNEILFGDKLPKSLECRIHNRLSGNVTETHIFLKGEGNERIES